MGRTKVSSPHLALRQRFLRQWREDEQAPEAILLAYSGGVDSAVLLDLLKVWRPMFGFELAVAHVHHGPGSTRQTSYRNRVLQATRRHSRPLRFFVNADFSGQGRLLRVHGPEAELRSEAELRDFRRGWLLK